MSTAFWICASLTVVSSLVSGGFAANGLRAATRESRTSSMYALARSVALVVVAIVGLTSFSIGFEAAAALSMILVQGFDAVIGAVISDRVKTLGPAITALVNAAALIWMFIS